MSHDGPNVLRSGSPAMRRARSLFTTTERLGRAMLRVVQGRADKYILEVSDVNRIGA